MKRFLFVILTLLSLTALSQTNRTPNTYNGDNSQVGLTLTISGVAFTGAAFLETGYMYGTYTAPMGTPNAQYVIPPFWQQTPRNVMLVVGVGLTATGLITMAVNR